ncbi:MAG TPA: preprotein translocase subunit SecG [Candidatus Paceibacterota bacterium]|nr:preprotein translocase subunit SecG [Candidatus Paceibacterota bacterium]
MATIAKFLPYVQIVLSVLLIASILLQQRGAGMSSAFGGMNMEYSSKRGIEKVLYYATMVIAALFLIAAVISVRLA